MTNSVGLKPVLSCATVLRENNAKGRTPSQSSPDSTHKALITRLMVLCTRSTSLLWGWLTDDLVTLMPNLLKKVVVNSLVKDVLRSDCISRGNPILEKILVGNRRVIIRGDAFGCKTQFIVRVPSSALGGIRALTRKSESGKERERKRGVAFVENLTHAQIALKVLA
ncbi:hypothetical protein TNCV_3765251 [Trichonephila clavipes]|nr:hypothetical protein TNCV_3765251 [Trichonephila clavipes]